MAGTLSSKRVERALGKLGCEIKRITASHYIYLAPNGVVVTLPLGHRDVAVNLVKKEMKTAGIAWEAFLAEY
jgi:predicted RNA binding protein YcfA (HicA-like mRNA interferase family)